MTDIPKNTLIKKLSEGAYGCVFKPGFECSGEIINSNEYVTKVQKKKRFSRHDSKTITQKELEIASKVRKIKNFEDYFAPILESCPINISKISNQGELKKCELIDREMTGDTVPDDFDSNKIKYAGKNSLADYLLSKKMILLKTFIEKHKDILESLAKLFDGGVIHFDLKENNIICRDITGFPVLIDFGLSIDYVELDAYDINTLGKFFYVYAPDYGPWCIDIAVLSFIGNKLDPAQKSGAITIEIMTKLVVEFINANNALQELLDDSEKNALKTKLMGYFEAFVGKTWKELVDDLIKRKASWDNYSLTIIYLYLFKDLGLEIYEGQFEPFFKYKQLLKSIILSSPSERISCKDTIARLNDIFKNIKRADLNKMRIELRQVYSNKNRLRKIKMQIGKTKLSAIEQRDVLMDKLGNE
jgi:serine/threonine protein kinase